MEVTINLDNLSAVLEHCFSLHEADELCYMLTNDKTTKEDLLKYLKSISQ